MANHPPIASAAEQAIIEQLMQQARALSPSTQLEFICRINQKDQPGLLLGMHKSGEARDIHSLDLFDLCQKHSAQSNIPIGLTFSEDPPNYPKISRDFLPTEFIYMQPARAQIYRRPPMSELLRETISELKDLLTSGLPISLTPARVLAIFAVGFALGFTCHTLIRLH
jgi:hypothetical protein